MNAVAAAVRNRELRRVALAFAGFNGAEWAVWIAMLVYAYDRGGATAAGLVAFAQLVPSAIVAPLAASRVRSLALGYALQGVATALTAAVLLAGGPALLAYAGAVVASVSFTFTRPVQAALLPSLARSPGELTAANVLAGWVESAAVFAAPALTGLLLTVGSAGVVFGVMAAVSALSAFAVRRFPRVAVEHPDAGPRRAVRHDPAARLLLTVLAIEFAVLGTLDILYVVLAEAELDRPGAWAGYLNAAFGAGGLAAVVVTSALVGRRLAAPLAVASAAWTVAFALLAASPGVAAVFALLAAAGAARSVVDVSARTLLQRTAPPEAVARLFGVVEGVAMGATALGAALAPLLVAAGGAAAACAGLALLLVGGALLVARRIARLDAAATVPVVELSLARRVPMLAALDPPTLEALARSFVPVTVARGEALIRQGEIGDRYYVVADGELEVLVDGAKVNEVGRGDGVGEIALLADVPRTASVVARSDVEVLALERAPFLRAVTASDRSAAVASELLAAHGLHQADAPSSPVVHGSGT